jgi:hypothetical protein
MEEEMTTMVEVKAVSRVIVKVEVEVDLTFLTVGKKTTSAPTSQ